MLGILLTFLVFNIMLAGAEGRDPQAIILKFDSSILIPTTTTPLIYPYVFVNLDSLGVSGVLMWIGILSVAFVVVGYLFFGIDKIGKK